MVNTDLDLIVDVRLQILQIAIHIVEVVRHTLGCRDKSALGGITAGILRDLLQCLTQVIEDRLESGLAVVGQILFDHLTVVSLRVELSELRLVLTELLVVEAVTDPLDGQRVDAGARTAIGSKYTERVHGFLLYFLTAVTSRTCITYIVSRRVEGRVRCPQSRCGNFQTKKC